jgi:heme exporter protein A
MVMTATLTLNAIALKKGFNLLIHNLSFELKSGEAISLTGRNGVGKTTLLRTIAGFSAPHRGTVAFNIGADPVDRVEFHSRHIHFLGHLEGLNLVRTVADELRFQSDFLGGNDAAQKAAIARLNLKPLLDLETRYLSAGQKRRLSLARLLMIRRTLWLLDEPMAPLDTAHRALLAEIMAEHLESGGMIIAAVHDALPFETIAVELTRPTRAEQEAEHD